MSEPQTSSKARTPMRDARAAIRIISGYAGLVLAFLMLCLVRALTDNRYVFLLVVAFLMYRNVRALTGAFSLFFYSLQLSVIRVQAKTLHTELSRLPSGAAAARDLEPEPIDTAIGRLVGMLIGMAILAVAPIVAYLYGRAIVAAMLGAA